jgi:hypothetical protein
LQLSTVAGPVASGAEYAANASLTLPLTAGSQAGTYDLPVKVNAEGNLEDRG